MWFIGGLGNPGKKYQFTRHNIGFNFIDELVKEFHFKLDKKDKVKEIYKGAVGEDICFLCKPLTYMNNSGEAISEIINFYKIPKSQIIIIHDDLDLEVGKIKIKIGGGNGGHNGLNSIDEKIGNNYKRLRIGIGHPGVKNLVSKYVLEKFKKDENKSIKKILDILVKNFDLLFKDKSLILTRFAMLYKEN